MISKVSKGTSPYFINNERNPHYKADLMYLLQTRSLNAIVDLPKEGLLTGLLIGSWHPITEQKLPREAHLALLFRVRVG